MNYIATVISNRPNGYNHLYRTGPPAFASNGKCIGKQVVFSFLHFFFLTTSACLSRCEPSYFTFLPFNNEPLFDPFLHFLSFPVSVVDLGWGNLFFIPVHA